MRAFDPETQRTVDALKEVHLVPAREVLFTEQTRPRAEAAARAAADRINLPTSSCASGWRRCARASPASGWRALLPGFFEGGLGTVFDYLRAVGEGRRSSTSTIRWALDRAAGELWAELERAFAGGGRAARTSRCPPPEHFLTRERG